MQNAFLSPIPLFVYLDPYLWTNRPFIESWKKAYKETGSWRLGGALVGTSQDIEPPPPSFLYVACHRGALETFIGVKEMTHAKLQVVITFRGNISFVRSRLCSLLIPRVDCDVGLHFVTIGKSTVVDDLSYRVGLCYSAQREMRVRKNIERLIKYRIKYSELGYGYRYGYIETMPIMKDRLTTTVG